MKNTSLKALSDYVNNPLSPIRLLGKNTSKDSYSRSGCFTFHDLFVRYANHTQWYDLPPKVLAETLAKAGVIQLVIFPDGDLRWRYRKGIPEQAFVWSIIDVKHPLPDVKLNLLEAFFYWIFTR